MRCPHCDRELRCVATRSADGIGVSWLAMLGRLQPALVARRRRCEEHGTIVTVELPVGFVQGMLYREGSSDEAKAG